MDAVRQDGHRVDVRVTWETGDSRRYAKEAAAQGVDTIVAARLPWVEVEVPTSLHVNLDGEPIQDTTVRFETHKQRLRFHLPDDSPVLTGK